MARLSPFQLIIEKLLGRLQEKGIKYGFTITVPELPRTIPTLWPAVQEYREAHTASLPSDNMLPFVTDAQVCALYSSMPAFGRLGPPSCPCDGRPLGQANRDLMLV